MLLRNTLAITFSMFLGSMSLYGAQTVHMMAHNGSFSPAVIEATPGEEITVMLHNEGTMEHSIMFDLPSGAVGLEQALAPGGVGTVTFTAPQGIGSYTFYCPVANHYAKGMAGKLIVNDNPGGKGGK